MLALEVNMPVVWKCRLCGTVFSAGISKHPYQNELLGDATTHKLQHICSVDTPIDSTIPADSRGVLLGVADAVGWFDVVRPGDPAGERSRRGRTNSEQRVRVVECAPGEERENSREGAE